MKKETGSKILLFSIIALFLISIISTSVSAEVAVTTEDARAAGAAMAGGLVGFAEGVLTPILDPLYGDAIATRIMLGILLFLIIWTIMPNIIGEDHPIISPAVSLVITALAIMSIPKILLATITAQYGIMGATILSIIPFAIIVVFSVRVQNALIARATWICYSIYYLGFYLYLIFSQSGTGTWYWVTPETIPYVIAICAGIGMFIGIGEIRRLIFKGEMSALKESGDRIADRGALLHKLQKRELDRSYGLKK